MSPSRRSAPRIDRAGIGETYGEVPRIVDAWVKLLNFPSPVVDGEWDAQQVDDWVKASRPQSWPARSVKSGTAASEPAVQGEPELVAEAAEGLGGGDELLGKAGLVLRYQVSEATVGTWTRVTGANVFPEEAEPGRWRAGVVDSWVAKHRAHVWAEITGEGPKVVVAPPDGDPKDLYDVGGYGEILGNATRGKPLPRATAQTYKRQGHLEPPDRRPGDRKKPEVFEDMWFLETITRHVYSRRGQGRLRAGRTRRTHKKS
ncbi:hypothetical protein AB0D66_28425 [Streptomyces sp. NPDC048270]|uniref:hypothetical protein n=1 Tax=Streptomyces sp. NPDC048270 TaxID=3154615 RepID=UPI003405D9ED